MDRTDRVGGNGVPRGTATKTPAWRGFWPGRLGAITYELYERYGGCFEMMKEEEREVLEEADRNVNKSIRGIAWEVGF